MKKTPRYGIVVTNLKGKGVCRSHTYCARTTINGVMKNLNRVKTIVDKRNENGAKLVVKVKDLRHNRIVCVA